MKTKLCLLLCAALLLSAGLLSFAIRAASQRPVPPRPATKALPPTRAVAHHEVKPSETDAKINSPDFPHETYARADGSGDLLFLYIPGTGGRASNTSRLLLAAVDAGYHAVAVDYDSSHSADEVCGDDADCYGPVRRELLDGQDESPKIDIDADNSILNRTRKLIKWLDAQYPNERWGQFMSGGRINWEKVTVSGLSQGGGHAAMIAKLFKVYRVVMFSSVDDAVGGPRFKSAAWITQPHATPSERYYGFGETNDHRYYPRMKVNWETLALPGKLTSVDDTAPPYNNSHRLTSSLDGSDPHAQVVRDSLTPLDANGDPVYLPVWRYMIGP